MNVSLYNNKYYKNIKLIQVRFELFEPWPKLNLD